MNDFESAKNALAEKGIEFLASENNYFIDENGKSEMVKDISLKSVQRLVFDKETGEIFQDNIVLHFG